MAQIRYTKVILLLCRFGLAAACILAIHLLAAGCASPTPTPIGHTPPPPTKGPTATPRTILSSVTVRSELQADGTRRDTYVLSQQSLGRGYVYVNYPKEVELRDSCLVRLSIVPNPLPSNFSGTPTSRPQPTFPAPMQITDTIEIYPLMRADLYGTGFEITADSQPEKAILSDRPAEWVWSLRPKERGPQWVVIHISLPVRDEGTETRASVDLGFLPALIWVYKSQWHQIEDMLTIAIPALIGLLGVLLAAILAILKANREQKIAELQEQIDQGSTEKRKLEDEIERLKSIPRWRFWRK